MSTLLTPQEIYEPPEGAQITPADWLNLIGNIDNAVGYLALALGITDALPPANPVTIAPQGGMALQAGGSGQLVIAQGRVLDICPASPLPVATADPTLPRLDLIAVQATRVPGASTITRNVRADSAPLQYTPLTATLVAGTATIALPAGYTVAPIPVGIAVVGSNPNGGTPTVISVSAAQAIVTSKKADGTTDATDTRVVNLLIQGTPTGYAGVATAQPLYENRPAWQIIAGTPNASPVAPATPSGWEAFATVAVGAAQTVIVSGNITILFKQLPSLTTGLVQSVTAGSSKVTVGGTAANPTVDLPYAPVQSVGRGSVLILLGGTATNPTIDLAYAPVASVSAGSSKVTVGGTTANPTIDLPYAPVQSVGAGSPKVTVGGTATNPTVDLPAQPVNTITSSDNSVTVTPSGGGASVDLSVSKVGQVIENNGQGSVGTGSTTVSLPTLPGSSAANYKVTATVVFGAGGGGTTETFTFAGTVGNSTGADTNTGFTYGVHNETAHGGQAPSVTVVGSGATTGGPVQIDLKAIRQ